MIENCNDELKREYNTGDESIEDLGGSGGFLLVMKDSSSKTSNEEDGSVELSHIKCLQKKHVVRTKKSQQFIEATTMMQAFQKKMMHVIMHGTMASIANNVCNYVWLVNHVEYSLWVNWTMVFQLQSIVPKQWQQPNH